MIKSALFVKNVSHGFGKKKILHNVNLNIGSGEFVSLIGPSGCGKSTLLKAILGTHPPQEGEIFVNAFPVVRPNRNVGIVYQDYSLYDYMTAKQNVAFGLALDQTGLPYRFFGYLFGWKKMRKTHLQQAEEMLEAVGLGHAINLYPSEMSGGMKQRVAIAQALIMKPKILLLDEPFGALDEATREDLQDLLIGLRNVNEASVKQGEEPPYTILIVTHELNEAIYLSHRVVGLSQYYADANGKGATIVYDKPATANDRKDERDYTCFIVQKDELRNIVFNEQSTVVPI